VTGGVRRLRSVKAYAGISGNSERLREIVAAYRDAGVDKLDFQQTAKAFATDCLQTAISKALSVGEI
jgi:hypothetical protein